MNYFESAVKFCKKTIEDYAKDFDFLFGLSDDPNRKEICRKKGNPRTLSDYATVQDKAKEKIKEACGEITGVEENNFQKLKEVCLKHEENFIKIGNHALDGEPLSDSDIKEILNNSKNRIEFQERMFNKKSKK